MGSVPQGPTPAGPALQARRLTLGYDGREIVRELDLDIPDAKVTSIIGPNGCGKSTLLKGLGRVLPALGGEVLLDGRPLTSRPSREIAQRLSMLPQTPQAPSGLTVADLVSRGRHPRQKWYQQFSATDELAVASALAATDLTELAPMLLEDLSGGQRQRAWISMTIAQETDILLLDEPTTYLDLAHQLEVLELVRTLNESNGRTVVMVLHDISLAARYSDHIVAMKDGGIVAQGTPAEVVTAPLLEEVFGLRATVIEEPLTGRPHVLPIGVA
ncbi:ABC transporter ATP-binding protein [Arthrobacter sp. CJ23]|uniref:ABC transporter ATP-binding protein n=1 Tax=Arthrobacter sp. CJ23 TaxID=2972479 RepID=UPI00215C362B|nr:ABC transporter ATP-binding protein [Arthrobacter sp. CJ23]